MTNIWDTSQIFRNPLFLISSLLIYNTTMQMNVNLHFVGAQISVNAIVMTPLKTSTTGIGSTSRIELVQETSQSE